ncbi:dihydropyrimidinase [Naematelia encephala]|uniref:dihydropyrimidinase n=1 Tax=Naematelia encephala TaxID=71784 RepID=A0A1Y2AGF9_9TREE|nr:dihydropyrimidinase [Naematelia encephala]
MALGESIITTVTIGLKKEDIPPLDDMYNPFDFDLVVKNGIVVTASDETECDIGVKDGLVVCLGKNLPVRGNCEVIDAEGGYITPGGVDSHVHLGQSASNARSADDWTTGTRGAISGGTTTVVAFAVQARGKSVMQAVEAYYDLADGKTHCDYSYHCIITDPNEAVVREEIPRMVDFGITSVKIYMTYPLLKLNDKQVLDVLCAARRTGVTTMVHAENADIIDWMSAALVERGLVEPWHHGSSRPPLVETEATNRAIALAEVVDSPMLIVHVSSKEATAHIRNAQTRGLPLYGETCPHYALLTADKMHAPGFEGAKCVCAPPLRSDPNDKESIWEGLANGTFTVFSSDHAPYNFHDEKGKQLGLVNNPTKNPQGNFKNTPNGLPGVCTRTPLLWSKGVLDGRISRQKFVELNSTNAAKLYGMYPKKGTIQPGSDADLIIWRSKSARRPVIIEQKNLHHGTDYTPYEGMEIHDWPRLVLLRGKIAYDGAKNEVVAPMGSGEFIKRGFSSLPGPKGHSVAWLNGFNPHDR